MADFKFDPLREVKLVPDVLLNFQLTLDRLTLFSMQSPKVIQNLKKPRLYTKIDLLRPNCHINGLYRGP